MLKIEINNHEKTEKSEHDIGVNFVFRSENYSDAVAEIAAALSVMFEKLPREVFYDGLFASELGKDVMKHTEGIE